MNLNPFAFRPGPVAFWTSAVYLILIIALVYVQESVPNVPKASKLPVGVNLTEAWGDLQAITASFHPYASHANDDVRAYLLTRAQDILVRNKVPFAIEKSGGVIWNNQMPSFTAGDSLGAKPPGVTVFDDEISNITFTDAGLHFKGVADTSPLRINYFESNNIYLYVQGKEDPEGDWWRTHTGQDTFAGRGGVLVNCHFDSVATGYGATDDGVSCVSMLQMLSHFTSTGKQPKHGIVLLFNNAEEDGLFGASAFGYSPVLPFCHSFVNLEGAGAGGRAILFRTTDLETAEAYGSSPHPFGSIIAADAFELGLIKSGTDYQVFVETFGQRGLDIAFYSPRSRYHTEDDDARHTSVRSIWHMLSAALASTSALSKASGSTFDGDRADGRRDLVQNGRPTEGVWFDFFGRAWAAFPLRGLFAWTLTLLITTPLILAIVTVLLIKNDKYYLFSSSTKNEFAIGDDTVPLGGWKGLLRFPFALILAATVTAAATRLVVKINPLIIYSSSYAIWVMVLSIFYFSFWFIVRSASYVRPTALHRAYSLIWIFVLTWGVQIFVAVLEDRMHIGAFYFMAFFHTMTFLALLVSLLELFALPGKEEFVRQFHDADVPGSILNSPIRNIDDDGDDEDEDAEDNAEASETTPLRAGEQGYGSGEPGETTFANTYRRSGAVDSSDREEIQVVAPYANEQSWSGKLPSWTWLLQLLLLAPIHVILVGNIGLFQTASMAMTGVDGGSLATPITGVLVLGILLLLPLTPFLHRVTHHLPVVLLVAFLGTFIYNLSAFPFSVNYRFKYYFQQVVDLDNNTNTVSLAGLEEFIRPVIATLPAASGQEITCSPATRSAVCTYDASRVVPNPVDDVQLKDLITVSGKRSADGASAFVQLDALDTRTCWLDFSRPVYGFSVEGGAPRDTRSGRDPRNGLAGAQVWRRKWEGAWNMTLDLGSDGKGDKLDIKVRCAWSDVNDASRIPAFHELQRFAPEWSTVSKASVGLVEVVKTIKV